VGDQWSLDGDLGDLVGDSLGGFGNVDIPICGGVNGVGPLALPVVPEVLQGLFLDRFIACCWSSLAIQSHSGLVSPAV